MSIHTTDVIVLRRYPFRETSIIVSCLTERFGKLKGLVKGIRGPKSRHRSAMEPLTVNRIVFYDTRTSQLHLISQCELLAPLSELPRDLKVMTAAARCVNLIDGIVPLEEPQPAIYHLLKDTLERLSLGVGDHAVVQMHCMTRLLRLVGFQPRLDQCTHCNADVQASGYWSARQGGLLCARCLHVDPSADAATPEMLAVLEAFSLSDHPPATNAQLIPALRQRLDEFLRWHVERTFRTATT